MVRNGVHRRKALHTGVQMDGLGTRSGDNRHKNTLKKQSLVGLLENIKTQISEASYCACMWVFSKPHRPQDEREHYVK
jgi:hypothetical protein